MAILLPINPKYPEPRKIRKCVEVLKNGGVIAYPTGTVYGFGCDLYNKKAIEKVYQIKGANRKKPFSFLCPDLSNISIYAALTDKAYRIMKRLVPGPYTFILEATKEVPKLVQSKRKTVGIRVPDHPIAQALLRELGSPIISTSARRAGEEIINDPREIAKRFPAVDIVIDGGLEGLIPSTVISIDSDGNIEIIREGAGDHELIYQFM